MSESVSLSNEKGQTFEEIPETTYPRFVKFDEVQKNVFIAKVTNIIHWFLGFPVKIYNEIVKENIDWHKGIIEEEKINILFAILSLFI